MSEEVTGYVKALMTRGLRGDLHCFLVFTTQRIIVAVQSMLFQVASGLGAGGTLGGMAGVMLTRQQDTANQLKQLSPQQILSSNKRNIELPFTNITKIQMGKKVGTSRVYLHTANNIYKFKFQFVKLETVEDTVRNLLPPSLSIEMGELSD